MTSSLLSNKIRRGPFVLSFIMLDELEIKLFIDKLYYIIDIIDQISYFSIITS